MEIAAIDQGNYQTKIVTQRNQSCFYSDIGEYRDLKLKNKYSENGIVFEYQGEKGFAGNLAKFESEFGGTMKGNNKNHKDGLIRILLALHLYTYDNEFKIIIGQPISSHTDEEKEKLINKVKGQHTIKVNNKIKTFFISDCKIAAEGAASFWNKPDMGLVRVIDIGSGTINGATILDKNYIDKDSFTLSFGANTNITDDYAEMSKAIVRETHKWGKDDLVYLVGGIAEKIKPYLENYFSNLEVIYPGGKHPKWSNVMGYYRIARGLYA